MTSIIAGLAEDVRAALEQLSKATEAVVIADTIHEKKSAEMAARPFMRDARSKVSTLRAEVRRTQDPATRALFDGICRDADEKVRALDAEMKRQIFPQRLLPRPKTYTERREEELMGAGGATGTAYRDSKEVLTAAISMQKDALISIERTERVQNVTEETGRDTLTTLRRQTEQMYHVDEELDNLQGQLDRAARDLKWFYRQMAGDKCFLSLLGICVLAIVCLVFVLIYKKRHP